MRAMLVVAILAVVPALVGGSAATRVEASVAGTSHALLIGCTSYPRLESEVGADRASGIRLFGPENDVALVRDVLVGSMGFSSEHIAVLSDASSEPDRSPTRANILREFARLAEVCEEGDRVVVYFAGHGSQQPAREAGNEPDGLDEVLLPCDVGVFDPKLGSIPRAITDDEIGLHLRAIRDRGTHVWLIVDACHSGSILRGESTVRLRGLEPDLLAVPRATPGFRRRAVVEAPVDDGGFEGITAFYAAQSYGRAPELAIEVGGGERTHGLFTWLLAQELVRSEGRASYRQLIQRVVAAYQAWPCSLTVPGALGDLDRPVLGLAHEVPLWQVQRSANGEFQLDRGRLAGIEVGALFDLLDQGGAALARLVVTSVEPFTARGVVADTERIAGHTSWPARLVATPAPTCSLPFAIVDSDGHALGVEVLPESVRTVLLGESHRQRFPIVAPEAAAWWLVRDRASWRLRPRASEGGQDLVLTGVGGLARDLARIARTRNLVALGSSVIGSALPDGLAVWVEVRSGPRARGRRLVSGEVVPPGSEVRIRYEKRAGTIYDLNLFFVDARHGMTRLFPRYGADARLEAGVAGVATALDWTVILDTSLGLEHVLAIAQERAENAPVLDLGDLEQDEVSVQRSATDDPVAALLVDIARAAPHRGVSVVVDGVEPIGVSLLTLDVRWPNIAPPSWPPPITSEYRLEYDASGHSTPPGIAAPLADAPRAAIVRRPGARTGDATLLLTGDASVETVAFDPLGKAQPGDDPSRALQLGTIAPLAVFRFEPERAVAFYRTAATRPFDLVLVDDDKDGLAETRFVLREDGWYGETHLVLPWLSQSWLDISPSEALRREMAETFAILASDRR